jgi:phosphonate transport system substrate-binding protein
VKPVSTKRNARGLPILLLPFLLFPLFLPGCGNRDEPRKVSLKPAEGTAPAPSPASPGGKRLRVSIAAMISPKESFVVYKDLMAWVAKGYGAEIDWVQRQKYEEVNRLLQEGRIDLAFVCTGAYVEGHDGFGLEMIAVPVAHGETVYRSYTIVPAESPVTKFEELRGKSFAFTDPMSNTGRLVPAWRLARMGETPESFFRSTTYTYGHDKSIESVSRGLVDGAAVDSLIYDFMEKRNPALVSRTRIVWKSDPYGMPPVVVSSAVPPEAKAKLRDLFLHAHENPEGREILSRIMVDKFVAVDDTAYDSVRAMKKWVDANVRK